MAQKVTVTLTDDLDNTLEAQETVYFALDGINYEIDLANVNGEKIREDFQPWIDAARKTAGRSNGRRPISVSGHNSSGLGKDELAAVRQWATANGIKVSSRGRVSRDLIAQYHSSNTNKKPATNTGNTDRVAAALAKAEAKVGRGKKSDADTEDAGTSDLLPVFKAT